ncbi:sugar ABC transporter permease [Nonomuraea sp. K274]|uniref:Sugar ABC transporter permease n=1 Tax=Nonomuraea cypriaca TaxID=1187855 RepID=A0A931F574_9ACTN|nr:sugar ABC transporter permease [Nonomuraea cypriaca]MBF8194435.1 sugar ABC transporter permease [Nonomuraea cypriaca]
MTTSSRTRTPTAKRPDPAPASNVAVTRSRRPSVYFWLLAPAVAICLGFVVYPLLRTVYLSFTDLDATGQAGWIGVHNYVEMLGDSAFWNSLRVSATFIVVAIAVEVVLAWTLALLLERRVSALSNGLRIIFAIPMMLCPVVIGITWRALLNPTFGWINALLGTPNTDWIGDPAKALWVLIAVDVWQWTPFLFMLISAGLLSIPEEVREAARLDGAGAVRILRHITIPMMLPVTLIAILLRTLDATKTFDLPYTLTTGGPGTSTQTMAIFLYRNAFAEFDQGYASAVAVTITIALTLFATVYLWITRRVERKLT